ncbi:hypothetical protein INR49_028682 [Caranx melampygus]|nr:hypothetical protein INR49_028682 [Caranx melampygus]
MEAKLEEKRKKEEEKRMKEEEKRLKEEKDRLKAEKSEITRFLQKPKIQQAPKTLAAACGKFAPFEIKENMALAPLCRVQCEESALEELDRCLLNPAMNLNGLKDWISQKPRWSGATKPRRTDSLRECVTVEGPKPDGVPDRERYGPMKLLQFHENYRPAYWGTWSKKSSHISPRCPLRQDKDLLDYEVDSDEEWEEEEPGESLSHSEGEDEEEGGEDDDDDDDGFFVPHGYLSDDEGALEEEEGGDLEKQKLRQKLKAREWDELMSTKKKMKVLEPVVRGCIWDGEGPGLDLLQPFAVCLVEPLPKADTSLSPEDQSQKCQREAQLLGQLLPLLHGNLNSSKVIITEFQELCRQQTSSSSPPELSSPQSPAENIPTRIQLKRLIKKNAVYEKRSTYRRCCWYVHTEVLSSFGQEALPVPCQWTYLTNGARDESREEPQAATGSQGNSPTTPQTSSTTSSSSNKRKSTGSMSITKFMKKCTDPEQTEAMEADGFQADTEDDDEDDCVIISSQSALKSQAIGKVQGQEYVCSVKGPNGFEKLRLEKGGALSTCSCDIRLHSCIPCKGRQDSALVTPGTPLPPLNAREACLTLVPDGVLRGVDLRPGPLLDPGQSCGSSSLCSFAGSMAILFATGAALQRLRFGAVGFEHTSVKRSRRLEFNVLLDVIKKLLHFRQL